MNYKPVGFPFVDKRYKDMLLVSRGEWKGWLAYHHPDGEWASLRKATEDNYKKLGIDKDVFLNTEDDPIPHTCSYREDSTVCEICGS